MTPKSSPLVKTQITHRRVLRIALPIVLANVTIPILGAVDTAVVGQLGDAVTIGAVGIGATILTALYWMFGFLRMGTTGFVAQAFGRGDLREMAAYLLRVLAIGFVAGLVVILLKEPLFALAFALSPASAPVENLAQAYMGIRVFSAPASIALYGVTGWLIGQERTRAVLMLQLWMNGLNVVLDLWFVLGLGLGAEGVAWATFTAEWTGLGLGLWLCRAGIWPNLGRDWAQVFDLGRLRAMFTVNRDILLRSLMLEAIFVSFILWGADFGDFAALIPCSMASHSFDAPLSDISSAAATMAFTTGLTLLARENAPRSAAAAARTGDTDDAAATITGAIDGIVDVL